MSMKKVISSIMAAALIASFASVTTFAAAGDTFDKNGVSVTYSGTDATKIYADGIVPNTTFYFQLGEVSEKVKSASGSSGSDFFPVGDSATVDGITELNVDDLVDSDLFKFSVDKDTNSKMVKSITLETEKNLSAAGTRAHYIKVVLNDSTTTAEIKSDGVIEFKAKATKDEANRKWTAGKTISVPYTLWINNKGVSGSDGSAGAGDRVYFDPTSNEENTFVWGDDRAALVFDANDNASKFYARLSTKSDADVYAEYGDPVNADLWFYDFVGNPSIPSTSRATLTLGLGWDQDSDYAPNPADCFIYEKGANGVLTDVTDSFTFSEDEGEIPGWSIKTRTLGTYIISDTELDLEAVASKDEETSSSETSEASKPSADADKEIPNTGSSDMVNVAVATAVASLAAAGAVAFKKASK